MCQTWVPIKVLGVCVFCAIRHFWGIKFLVFKVACAPLFCKAAFSFQKCKTAFQKALEIVFLKVVLLKKHQNNW